MKTILLALSLVFFSCHPSKNILTKEKKNKITKKNYHPIDENKREMEQEYLHAMHGDREQNLER